MPEVSDLGLSLGIYILQVICAIHNLFVLFAAFVVMKAVAMAKIIFITGTDTGVGKTVVTALLLCHLRQAGCNALAIKPFCSGSRADARLLRGLQEQLVDTGRDQPVFFQAARLLRPPPADRRKTIPLDTVLRKIRDFGRRCDVLLVEGIGGLMVPLGKNYTVADLISRLHCPVLIVWPQPPGDDQPYFTDR